MILLSVELLSPTLHYMQTPELTLGGVSQVGGGSWCPVIRLPVVLLWGAYLNLPDP